VKTCLFCSNTKLTREHIWPQWLLAMFPKRRRTATRKIHGQPANTWETNTLELTAKVVCRDCNEGWMSDLENYAKPFVAHFIRFRGQRTFLSDDAIVAITAWVTLRTMIMDTLLPRHPYYRDAEREAFKETLTPPDGTRIWLAMQQGRPYDVELSTTSARVSTTGGWIHVVNFVCADLVVQFFTSREEMTLPTRERMRMHEVTTELWPVGDARPAWPPEYHLASVDWRPHFCGRFLNLALESDSSSPPEGMKSNLLAE
jgi:hypothetical protein